MTTKRQPGMPRGKVSSNGSRQDHTVLTACGSNKEGMGTREQIRRTRRISRNWVAGWAEGSQPWGQDWGEHERWGRAGGPDSEQGHVPGSAGVRGSQEGGPWHVNSPLTEREMGN